jgi:predicted nucleic acid-binding protein
MPNELLPLINEQWRPEIVVDTCALLNLEAMGILPLALKRFAIVTSQTVVWELENTARYRDYDGYLAQGVLDWIDRMEVINLGTPLIRDQGERDCLQLARERKSIIISDNLAAVKMFDQSGINNHFSVFILFVLAMEKKIPLDQAKRALEAVRLKRRWKDNILYQTGAKLLGSLGALRQGEHQGEKGGVVDFDSSALGGKNEASGIRI